MRFDIENQVSVAQAFTGAVTVSTNSYKKQTAAQDLSIGRRMALLILPVVSADDVNSVATMDIIQADDDALTVNVEVLGTVTATAAQLAVGEQVELPIPQGVMTRQYLGFRHAAAGGVTNTVTLDVYLVPQDDIAQYKSFPKVNDADV